AVPGSSEQPGRVGGCALRFDIQITTGTDEARVVQEALRAEGEIACGVELCRTGGFDLCRGFTEAVLVAAIDRVGRRGIAIVDVAGRERATAIDEAAGGEREITPALDDPGVVQQLSSDADIAVAPGEELTAVVAQAARV